MCSPTTRKKKAILQCSINELEEERPVKWTASLDGVGAVKRINHILEKSYSSGHDLCAHCAPFEGFGGRMQTAETAETAKSINNQI